MPPEPTTHCAPLHSIRDLQECLSVTYKYMRRKCLTFNPPIKDGSKLKFHLRHAMSKHTQKKNELIHKLEPCRLKLTSAFRTRRSMRQPDKYQKPFPNTRILLAIKNRGSTTDDGAILIEGIRVPQQHAFV